MPPGSPKKHDRLSDGEKFALALGLENNPELFHIYKKRFREVANETFIMDVPLFQQTDAMYKFTEKIKTTFPELFNDAVENKKDRIGLLQRYARSYLEKSGKMTTGNRRPPRSNSTQRQAPLSPPPSPAENNGIIKVARPTPKPSFHAKKTSVIKDEPMPYAQPPRTPSRAPSSTRCRKVSLVDEPMVDVPLPETPVTESRASAHDTAATEPRIPPGSSAAAAAASDSKFARFLADCCPPMGHCSAAFIRAGVTDMAHLRGMAHWEEDRLRQFLTKQSIARSPLDTQALIIAVFALA
ncbi:hypothetical protein B0H15DRAFT_814437 [Mycena belliarum]|uniref:Uncharacterized protein n=1 Tax=Mycena belliarum TaxID=1033014 RepID=A0AAD6Y169_9AGAR|nr:hypothetical protein B0H15DRAFT_814437 [Mycena belliae]